MRIQEEKRGEKTKMVTFIIKIVTLNITGLNTPVEEIKNQNLIICCLQAQTLNIKT